MSKVKEADVFDKKEVFEKNCRELLDKLVLECSLNKIPFFFTACVKNTPESSEYERGMVGTGSRAIRLADDQISKHLAVIRGFDVIPRREEIEINMDELDFPD